MGSEQLKALLRRLAKRDGANGARPGTIMPDSPFDALMEQRLRALEREMAEVKGRINSLLFLVAAAVVERVVSGLVG